MAIIPPFRPNNYCREQVSRLFSGSHPASRELKKTNQTKTNVVVAVAGRIVVAIGRATVQGLVEVATATYDPVSTFSSD